MHCEFDKAPNHKSDGSFRWDMPGFPDDVIGMGTADLDYTCAPCIRETLTDVAGQNCYNYRQKPEAYYEALEEYYQRKYGLQIQREWISNVPSTIGAIRIALSVFAKPGDFIIAQTPLFGPLSVTIEGADCKLIANPLTIVDGRYEIDYLDFEAKIREFRPSVYLLVNPHNPTGRNFSKEEITRLVDICYAHGVTIISDEVHSLVVYGGQKFTPLLASCDKAKKIGIQVVSLSKGFNIMSLPHAIITIPNESMQADWMRQMRAYAFGYATNSFSIAAVTSILEGKADGWIKELTEYLYGNLQYAINFIERHNIPLNPYLPEASFLLWLDCREAGIGTEHLDQFFMERCHIHLDDGEANFGKEGRGFIRINIAVTREVLKEALERIQIAFR